MWGPRVSTEECGRDGFSTRFFRGSESLFDKARKCPFLVFYPNSTSLLLPLVNHIAHHHTTSHPVFGCSIDITWPVVQFQRPQYKNKCPNHEYCDFLFVIREKPKLKNIFLLNIDQFNFKFEFIVCNTP